MVSAVSRPGGRLLIAAVPPLAVALAVILVIRPGLMPDVGYWDTGEFQTVLPILGTARSMAAFRPASVTTFPWSS